MHVKIKITAEKNFNLSNNVIEKEILSLKEEDLINILRVCIVEDKKFKIRRLHVLIAAVVLVLIATVATLTAVFTSPNPDYSPYPDGPLCIKTRDEWRAENATEIKRFPKIPVPYAVISHTNMDSCNDTESCVKAVRAVQHFQFGNGFSDIGNNFLVGGDGCAYVGRGWDVIGAHTLAINNRSIGISFLGNFMTELPPRNQINAALLLLEEGIRLNKLTRNYKLFAHKQISVTDSPGEPLTNLIKTWPHWSEYNPLKEQPSDLNK